MNNRSKIESDRQSVMYLQDKITKQAKIIDQLQRTVSSYQNEFMPIDPNLAYAKRDNKRSNTPRRRPLSDIVYGECYLDTKTVQRLYKAGLLNLRTALDLYVLAMMRFRNKKGHNLYTSYESIGETFNAKRNTVKKALSRKGSPFQRIRLNGSRIKKPSDSQSGGNAYDLYKWVLKDD